MSFEVAELTRKRLPETAKTKGGNHDPTLTARYVKTSSGYMGQIFGWPEVVTEGENLEERRESLQDALQEIVLAHEEQGIRPPVEHALFEPISVETT